MYIFFRYHHCHGRSTLPFVFLHLLWFISLCRANQHPPLLGSPPPPATVHNALSCINGYATFQTLTKNYTRQPSSSFPLSPPLPLVFKKVHTECICSAFYPSAATTSLLISLSILDCVKSCFDSDAPYIDCAYDDPATYQLKLSQAKCCDICGGEITTAMFKRQDYAFRYESDMACMKKPKPSPTMSPTTTMSMSVSAYPSTTPSMLVTAAPSMTGSLSPSMTPKPTSIVPSSSSSTTALPSQTPSYSTSSSPSPSVSNSLILSVDDPKPLSCKLRTKRVYSVRKRMFGFHIVCRCVSPDNVLEKRLIGAPNRRASQCIQGCMQRAAAAAGANCGGGTSGMLGMTESCCDECMAQNVEVDVERQFRVGKRRMMLYRCKTV